VRGFRAIAGCVSVALVLGACGRSSTAKETGGGDSNSTTTAAKAATGPGDFGTMQAVCGSGDGKGATAQGVTDSSIRVATISDPGFSGRPGLNQEIFDAAEVFTKWCNDAGGINGRKIQLDEYDAALTNYQPQIQKACAADFLLVGAGAVFDNTGENDRLKCLLPSIPTYVVSPQSRDSDLTVQPVPNRTETLPVNDLRYLQEHYPEATKAVASLTAQLPATAVVEQQTVEAAKQLGWNVVFRGNYNAGGETTWTPIAQQLKDHNAKALLWTGEPQNLGLLEKALKDINYPLDFIQAAPNHYDQGLISQADGALHNTFMRVAMVPFEDASKNPATQQYLDLFAKYKPSGKSHAALGLQSWSAWLLFAKAVKECGSNLTRKCVYDNALKAPDWTGGGLHAAQDVPNQKPGTCGIMLEATPNGFVEAPGFTPNQGLFQCDPNNVVTLHGNYGQGAKLSDVGKSMADLK
jgi:ABC-type branched-subunit amino acid transport system substrate-binding protein